MIAEQYVGAHVAAYPADKGLVLVCNRSTGRQDVLPSQVFGILRQADRFDTLAGHMERLLVAGWENDGSGFIETAYRELIARGLLAPKSAFVKRALEEVGGRTAPPPITSLAVTTRDRVSHLQRCLGGFIENMRKHGRAMDYLVVDDSRNADAAAQTRGVLKSFVSMGANVFYAGKEEKLGFVKEIVREGSADGLPEDVVAFGLFGNGGYAPTYGTNRNAILLAAHGELIVMTDDDTVYRPAVSEKYEKTLRLTSMNDPTLLRYYASRKELLSATRTADVDIVSSHESLLGRTISGCASRLGPDCALEVDRIGPESVHKICRMPPVVSATMCGYWGDCGMGSPNAALELEESRDFAIHLKAEYVRSTSSREVFRSVSRYTISDGALFMTTNAGLDNRNLLPPFLPVGRNEDGVFAMTLHVCFEDALIGHLPLAIFHAPEEVRGWPKGAFLDPTPRLADILAAIVASFMPSPGQRSAPERLSAIGRLFMDIGSLSTDDFEAEVKLRWLANASRHIAFLEDLLDRYHGQPDYWARDVLAIIENFKDFIVHRSPAVPRELSGVDTEQAKETCRGLVRDFGKLLHWWPAIYAAGGRLREKGIRLARPV